MRFRNLTLITLMTHLLHRHKAKFNSKAVSFFLNEGIQGLYVDSPPPIAAEVYFYALDV